MGPGYMCVWCFFTRSLLSTFRADNPPASALTSSYLRHMFISAVHSNASRDQMAETAAHMSHTLTTAETHYEAHGALELTSRQTDTQTHIHIHIPFIGFVL